MDKAARARQRVLATFLPITALLYVSAEALNPKGADMLVSDTATAVKVLPIAAAHSAQLYLSGSLTLLALGGLAVSYPAIATLVRGRGWVVATVAALLGAVGAFCGIVVNVHVGVDRRRGGGTSHRRHGGTLPRDGLQLHVQQGIHGRVLHQ